MSRSVRISTSTLRGDLAGFIVAAFSLPLLAIEPTDYGRALLEERRSIVRLHLEMDTDLMAGNGVQLTRSKRMIWQDGDKRRCDEIREYLDGKGVTKLRRIGLFPLRRPNSFSIGTAACHLAAVAFVPISAQKLT